MTTRTLQIDLSDRECSAIDAILENRSLATATAEFRVDYSTAPCGEIEMSDVTLLLGTEEIEIKDDDASEIWDRLCGMVAS